MVRGEPSASSSRSQPSASSSRRAGDTELIYNPDLDVNVVRQVRSDYRDVLSIQAETRANLSAYKVTDLITELSSVNSLFGGVKRAQEATLDSKAVTNLSEMAALKARAMKHSAGGFDVDDFITKLVTFMGGRDADDVDGDDGDDEEAMDGMLNWDRIGYVALSKSRRAMGINCMLGPLSIETKKRVIQKRAQKAQADPKQNVIVQEVDIEEQQKKSELDTAFMVKQLSTLLAEQGEPVNYFKFVINPESFEQSVENIFYFSFLIKDGLAAWELEKDGEPMILSSEPATQEDFQQNFQKRQAIVEFDQETWKRAIEVFDIDKSIIPTRPRIPIHEKFPNFRATGKNRGVQQDSVNSDDDEAITSQVEDNADD